MKKQNTFKIISSLIICTVFLIFAYGSDKTSPANNSTSTQQSTPVDDNVCSVCNGMGVIATYSYNGCHDVSHYSHGDCASDHHTSECTQSGTKTCACCHGTGKNH